MQTDLENRAYADLLKHLWESGFFQDGYSNGRECAENVLTGFLDDAQLEWLLDEHFPYQHSDKWIIDYYADRINGKRPSTRGWYLVVIERGGQRSVTTCYYLKGSGWYLSEKCDPEEGQDQYVIKWQTLPLVPED